MHHGTRVALVIPAYNEEKLIRGTIAALPTSLDYIIVVNDASLDGTGAVLEEVAAQNPRVIVLTNEPNGGVGSSLKLGFRYAMESTDADIIGIASGDAQCDPTCMEPMIDQLIESDCDYVKGNRFLQREALKSMPSHRRYGNIFISLLTKFATGYYSVSDITMGYGFLRRSIMERIDFDLVKDRYDYEISMLVALSIADAHIEDHSVPAIYGEETSSIKLLPTVLRVLKVAWTGFWARIWNKYILYDFHPIALFLLGGLALLAIGTGVSLYLIIERIVNGATPSTGTVMLGVLPLILSFQLLLTAVLMDNDREKQFRSRDRSRH